MYYIVYMDKNGSTVEERESKKSTETVLAKILQKERNKVRQTELIGVFKGNALQYETVTVVKEARIREPKTV